MVIINRFPLTKYEPAGLKLSPNDLLLKETRNEAKSAMRIVEAIRKNLGWTKIHMELTLRKDGNWDHPGEVLDLSFLRKYVKHT